MELIEQPLHLRKACDAARQLGKRVGLVPTMGALHDGHLSLIEETRARGARLTVVSIFVNPLQFGQGEDLTRYPRTLQQDLAACRSHGVDLIYAPCAEAMYPPGFQSHVEVEGLTRHLEGASRPTHFRGVTTVVAKLFHAVGPCIAAFGRKDYQQWRVIDRMVRDLDMPIEVAGCPIVREPDGLAMSSRNRYLDPEQRQRAVALFQGLSAARAAYDAGERSVAGLVQLAQERIAAAFDALDYVSVADADDLSEPGARLERAAVMLAAARLGKTRLIDNMTLGPPAK